MIVLNYKFMPKALTPLKKQKLLNDFATFDIETNAWIDDTWGMDAEEIRKIWQNYKIKPFLVEFYKDKKIKAYEGTDCVNKFLKDVLVFSNRNIIIFAHNGGKFDFISLYEALIRDEKLSERFFPKPFLAKGRMIALTIKDKNNNRWNFRDSYALLPRGLDKLCQSFKPDDIKLVRPPYPYEQHRDEWVTYCANDCKSLHEILTIFNQTIKDIGGSIGYTIASTAMKTYRHKFLHREIPTYFVYNQIFRNAYYGGRVEIINMHAKNTGRPYYYYDCNSEYPYVMTKYMYPVSYPRSVRYKDAEDCKDKCGIMECHVIAPPDLNIPILPYRHPITKKLLFPLGEWTAFYEFSMIDKALKYGYDIKPLRIWEFPEQDYIFKEYVDRFYMLKQAEKEGAFYEVLKFLLNSLYGKHGEKPEHEELITEPNVDITGTYMYDDVFGYSIKKTTRNSAYQLLGIASRVTALAQLNLYSFIEKVQSMGGTIYYMDTDSLITDIRMDTNNELGGWKLVTDFKEGVFLAPKTYMIDTYDDDLIPKMKGFSNSFQNHLTMNDFRNALPPKNDLSIFRENKIRPATFKQIHVRKLDGHCFLVEPKGIMETYDKRIINPDLSTEPYTIDKNFQISRITKEAPQCLQTP